MHVSHISRSEIIYRSPEPLRQSIPTWNLLSRVVFRLYSSGADVPVRPDPEFKDNNTLILSFECSFAFERFARMSLQYQAGNTVDFVTDIPSGVEIVSRVLFNSTPTVSALPAV